MGQIYDEKLILSRANLVPDRSKIILPKSETLDTLARGDTKEGNSKGNFQKRAKHKTLGRVLNHRLLEVLDSPLRPRYLKAMGCCDHIFQNELKVTSKYCKQRSCTICNPILTMKLIKGYGPAIKSMREPVFMTLTIGRVQYCELQMTVDNAKKELGRIFKAFRVAKKRKGFDNCLIDAISKFECVYDERKNNPFHPHFHIIVDGFNNANDIKNEWIKRLGVNSSGQDIRRITNVEDASQELFKYVSKLVTDKPFSPYGFDAILQVTANKPIYVCYGNIKKVNEDISDIQSSEIDFKESSIQVWKYQRSIFDWICPEGEIFSGYVPNENDLYLFKNCRYPKLKAISHAK